MSKIKIQGNASGTGVLTIAAPNTNTDRTITIPDVTGELLNSGSDLPAANLTGTIADARFPATLPAISGANLTGVAPTKATVEALGIAASSITGALPAISGASLTSLPSQTANDFTNTLKTKLDGVEASATADQSKSDIEGLGIAASSITGALPAISGANLTNLPASGSTTLSGLTDTTVSTSDPAITTNPSATGHFWVNKTSGECYVCSDATSNNNVWKNVGEGTGEIVEGFSATGGTITTYGSYKVHTFTSNGTFEVIGQAASGMAVLVVAGGGGAGSTAGGDGGGGGAGGMIASSGNALAIGTYAITVGAGGAGSTNQSAGTNGGNSSIGSTWIAVGGGGGSTGNNNASGGGSGGGAGSNGGAAGTAGSATAGQGNVGGSGSVDGSGGGGAGSAGSSGGNGGNGAGNDYRTGSTIMYAGGGGGGRDPGNSSGGSGGGGEGSTGAGHTQGTDGLGGGGGGSGGGSNGKRGGSGIVVIRYSV